MHRKLSRRSALTTAFVAVVQGIDMTRVAAASTSAQSQSHSDADSGEAREALLQASVPVASEEDAPESGKLEDGRALCLSGGGYRAMLV
jgi:hypothetical protein